MHCLNLKITYNCSNKCPFCFSSYLKNNKISDSLLYDAIEKGYSNNCREIVFSGGEPTLKPKLLANLLCLATEIGYSTFIIQTNGFGLSNKNNNSFLLISALKKLSRNYDISISFSVHGHNSQLHDSMTGRVGAFKILNNAMNQIYKETSCSIYTNTVISSLNINYLSKISEFVSAYKPKIMQFSMMHLKQPSKLSTTLLDAVNAIKALKVDYNILRTEGIPFCLMHGMEKCVGESYWPSLDLYNNDNEYMADFDQLKQSMRWKPQNCSSCIMTKICMGVWKEHKEELIGSKYRPIN